MPLCLRAHACACQHRSTLTAQSCWIESLHLLFPMAILKGLDILHVNILSIQVSALFRSSSFLSSYFSSFCSLFFSSFLDALLSSDLLIQAGSQRRTQVPHNQMSSFVPRSALPNSAVVGTTSCSLRVTLMERVMTSPNPSYFLSRKVPRIPVYLTSTGGGTCFIMLMGRAKAPSICEGMLLFLMFIRFYLLFVTRTQTPSNITSWARVGAVQPWHRYFFQFFILNNMSKSLILV